MAWSWSIWSLLFLCGGRGGLLNHPPPIAFVIAGVGGLGPSLAGLSLTALTSGRAGLARVGGQLVDIHAGRWWWALLLIPAVTALTPVLRWLAGAEVGAAGMAALLLPGLALGLGAGLMEEFGWRGFLLPHLLRCHSPLRSALFVGLVWGGLWHGYADYFGIAGQGPAFWALLLLLGPGLLGAWSLVLTVVYCHTRGSLLLSVLMHASISSTALVLGQTYDTPQSQLQWAAISVALAWAAAGALWCLAPPDPVRDAPSGRWP
jgi:membrane protease YdiL (CAAX protease family)